MQISKTLLVACAGFLCAAPVVPGARPDSDEQAKARKALEQKMKQLETQQPPAAAPARKPAPAPQKAQASQTYMSTNLVVISAPESTSPETYDKLSQAVEKKWQEILSSEAQVYQPLPASVTGKISGTGAAAALLLQNESAQNALSQVLQTPPGYAPLLGPPPSITAAQQKQLNDLLVLYEADRLTPEQYHERRAKILGEH